MLRLLLSRPAMLLWGVLLAQWLAEEPPRRKAPRRRMEGPRPRRRHRPPPSGIRPPPADDFTPEPDHAP